MNHSSVSQETVFSFLADPATHGGNKVRRIDTHAAAVFLAGDRAYKIKRAVRFPFLDYSTLARRYAACRAELDVNRPYAPQLYLRVVPVVRAPDGRLRIDGAGEPVEWAVEMRRFDENRTLDHLAVGGRIDDALAEELARAVAAMHARTPIVDFLSWVAELQEILNQNAAAFREFPELFPPETAERLNRAAQASFERLRPLLLDRGSRGLVRRGHGDLHLANIAMIDGRPLPFDAIEFDPMIAAGDVLYDLAFLLMDLAERGLKRPANVVLNRYVSDSGCNEDLDGLAALPFFMSLRAAIRAKVVAAQMRNAEGPRRNELGDSAKVYFELAQKLLMPAAPVLVAIGGLSGTGKSTIARALAPCLEPSPGAVIARSDVERKRLFGVEETERLSEEAYSADVSTKVYASVYDKSGRALAARYSAVADAVFGRADERGAIANVAAQNGARFCGIFLVAGLDRRLERVGRRVGDASDADAAVVRGQDRQPLNHIDWVQIDASGSVENTLKEVCAAVGCAPPRARREHIGQSR
jgi:aminoglycoside phosphotransferase family enzyme/predicted kinase